MKENNTLNSSEADSAEQVGSNSNNQLRSPSQGFIDTVFTETLGLGMHNAVTSQLNSQISSSASITSACVLLLKTKPQPTPAPSDIPDEVETMGSS